MLTTIQPAINQLRQQPGRARALLAALVFLITVVIVVARRFGAFGSGGDRKGSKRNGSTSPRSSSDRRSSHGTSSPPRRHKHSSKHHSSHSRKLDSSLPTLYVLVGVHGSGKSTWAKQFVEKVRKSAVIISSDEVRTSVAGSSDNYSREGEVEERLLKDIEHNINLRRTLIVDDCQHNLDPNFRAKLLAMAVEGDYNRVMRRFPIKALFARTRIDKDIAEGKMHFNPSPFQLEELIAKYEAVDEVIKAEGWYEDK